MVFGLFLECCGFKSLDLSQLALDVYKLEDGSLMGFRGTYDSPTYKSRKEKRKTTVGLCCSLTIIVYSLDNDISPLNLRAKRRSRVLFYNILPLVKECMYWAYFIRAIKLS